MTTIIHHKGVLYADRLHLRAGMPVSTFKATKIFTSANKQFAYGVSGRGVKDSEKSIIEEKLNIILQKACIENYGDQILLKKLTDDSVLAGVADRGTWVVMTKTRVFIISQMYLRDSTDNLASIGTGGWFASGMIHAGMTPSKALMNMGDLDVCTGGGVDKITAKSLKPFIITGVVK